ncbi:MAG TPA: (Fe-S)-binding protein [Planctomycetaceae bacterium]|nr:(Fe-S)-binding protein [Planctomycetaceae bacterium]
MDVSLMVTCLGDVFRPNAAMATVRVLERLGVRVHFPEEQTCCGQPFYNSGFMQGARDLARHTIQAFADDRPVVTPSGSCAAMLKIEYPHLFPDDPEWARRAEHLAARTFELSDFLVNQLMVTQLGARFEGKVAYHYACHLRGLGLKDEAESLIRNVAGVDYRPLRAQDQCCGFGGSFAVRYPQISTAMVRDKVTCIIETDADVVVSTDAGCLMNIGGALHRNGLPMRTMHLAELLDSR